MRKIVVSICGFIFALCSHALAVTMDDLKGYSIEVNATRAQVFRPDNEPHNPASSTISINHRLYFGLSGNIFDYSKVGAGMYSGQGSQVDAGRLTLLIKVTEGFIVQTIAVDPTKSTCTFSETAQRDPATGRLMVQKLNGLTNEVVSFSTVSSSCTIKKGNIFATDQ
jgi:hypothetical protein